jgi:acylphosphatase
MPSPVDPAPVAVRLVVTGRVQGVGYRESCRHRASELGVAGWVRNRADGAVEACVEGSAAAVDAMVAWCREGPRWARVNHCSVEAVSPSGFRRFEVR